MHPELEEVLAELDYWRKRCNSMRAMLRKVEHSDTGGCGCCSDGMCCPNCGHTEGPLGGLVNGEWAPEATVGHYPDCELAALLGEK